MHTNSYMSALTISYDNIKCTWKLINNLTFLLFYQFHFVRFSRLFFSFVYFCLILYILLIRPLKFMVIPYCENYIYINTFIYIQALSISCLHRIMLPLIVLCFVDDPDKSYLERQQIRIGLSEFIFNKEEVWEVGEWR